jgi:PAS domain S-box-containing protein
MKPSPPRHQQLKLIQLLLFIAIATIIIFILPGFGKSGYWLNNLLALVAIAVLVTAIFFINKEMRHVTTASQNSADMGDQLPQETTVNTPTPANVEKRFQALVQNSHGITALIDKNFNFLFRSSSAAQITGWTNEDIAGIPQQYVHPEDWEPLKRMIVNSIAHQGQVLPIVARLKHKDGHYIWLKGTVKNMLQDPDVGGLVINIHDATGQKEAEEKINKANRLYFFISQVNQVILKVSDEASLFKEVCRIAVDIGQFKMAWIGLIDQANQYLVPVVHAGEAKDYLVNLTIPAAGSVPQSLGPTGSAIRQGKHVVCNDIQTAPEMAPWRDAAIGLGYLSSISLPIKKSGRAIGAFSLYAAVKYFFNKEEIDLLLEVTADISFALEIFEREKLRTHAEEMVLKSKQQYKMLTEISPVGIFHTDVLGITTFVNPRWCQIAGLSIEEALGNGWLRAVHEDDRAAVVNNWQQATKKHAASSFNYRFVHSDDSVRWVLGQATPEKNEAGQIAGYVGTITDITDLKTAEEKILYNEQLLTKAQEIGKLGYWQQDLKTGAVWASKQAMYIYGFPPKDGELNREKIAACIIDLQKVKEANDGLIQSNKEYNIEFAIHPADGSPMKYISALAELETNEQGEPVRIVGTLQDITQRTKAQEEINQTTEKLRRLTDHLQNIREEERKTIGREIHDELGQQLTAINMDVAWIDKKIPEENVPVKIKLKNIIQLLNGSNQAVRRILSELRPLMLDDYNLLDAITKLAKQFTDKTGIPVHLLDEAGEINVTEQVANCIFRACQESFTNITRYAKANNVMMRVHTTDNSILVSIADDGIGFDIAAIQYGKSFGILGMKERVISQGGIFDITSTVEKGTKIVFSLPLKNKTVL